ncbi:NADPH-dependent FMN reductase [Actinomycetes bacterium KLBMP 9797]
MSQFTVLALSGSLRQGSLNTGLLRAAQRLAPENLTIEIYDRLAEIAPFNEDVEQRELPEPVADLRARVKAADGLLIATPEYNYGAPGVLKNALDWTSRPDFPVTAWVSPLAHKPVAILGAAPTALGTVRAQLALRQLFLWTDSAIVTKPEVIVMNAHEKLAADGTIHDPQTEQLLSGLLDALVTKIRVTELATTAA